MKKYIITCSTNAYIAAKFKKFEGHDILERDGATPVKWIHDDNLGYGFTLTEARQKLMSYAREDSDKSGEAVDHKFFENRYDSDVYTFAIEGK